ncbi:cupin [Candidatus Saccharibacteria bacterium]|nr:MAG: cupin [Candidatus Saccharibacteria bacterium]
MADSNHPTYDPKDFSQASYVRRIEKPWGWELHWVPEEAPYMGKVIHVNAGARLSLQIHDEKQESWFLMAGKAKVIWENSKGELTETVLENGVGYSTAIGQRHRLVGVTDCDIIEVSTPEKGTTWRLEDDYLRPDETEEQRKVERA